MKILLSLFTALLLISSCDTSNCPCIADEVRISARNKDTLYKVYFKTQNNNSWIIVLTHHKYNIGDTIK